MNSAAANNQIAFLHGTWRALLQDQPEPFSKELLSDFVSSDVLLGLPARTTLSHVLHECHAREAVQESYIKSFLGLRKVWQQLTPESRHIILRYSNKCGLQKQGGLRLNPLEDDGAALTIRWDVAARLYESARDTAFKTCRELGLEMIQPRGTPQPNEFHVLVNRGRETLLSLLRERTNIDKTAVTMAVGYVTPVARTKLARNLANAQQECLEAFRAALHHWASHNPAAFLATAPGAQLSADEEAQIRGYIEECLKPWHRDCEHLRQDADGMSSEPTIYEKVRRCFQDPAVLH
jgi:hypothetical protein